MQIQINSFYVRNTARKVSKYGVFSGPYFLVFGLNMEIYFINLRIQSECRKIRTRKNAVFGHFLRSESNEQLNIIKQIEINIQSDKLHRVRTCKI